MNPKKGSLWVGGVARRSKGAVRWAAAALLVVLLGRPGLSQVAGGEWVQYFPPKAKTGASGEAEVRNLLRLLRQGSGPDRLEVRDRLVRPDLDAVPILIGELESGNQWYSANAALVLGERRDPRALEPLMRVVAEVSRGNVTAAALALGRLRDPASLPPLSLQVLTGRVRESRRAAALALGRMRHPEGVARLRELLRESKQESDRATAVTALAMSGSTLPIEDLAALSQTSDDRARRAVIVALAALPPTAESSDVLVRAVNDEDEQVRISALCGLALSASPARANDLAVRSVLTGHTDDHVRAACTLAVGARAGRTAASFLQQRMADSSERVRSAVMGSLIAAGEAFGEDLIALGLADRHSDVRRAAVIAGAVVGARRAQAKGPTNWFLIDDSHADVRDASLVALAWRQGGDARDALLRVNAARKEDRLVDRSGQLLRILEGTPALAHRVLRAQLQVILDDAGLAPSWNIHRQVNIQILDVLSLDKALPELIGAGAAGEDRAKAAAVRRVAPQLEDLRRHLDRYPYSDWREQLEIPLIR